MLLWLEDVQNIITRLADSFVEEFYVNECCYDKDIASC